MSKALLLEALAKVDSAVITEAVKTEISEAFDAAVEAKATEKAKALQESVEKATESYMTSIVESHVVDLKESFEKAVTAKATELAESYTAEATKELKEKFNTDIAELTESLEKYMQYAVDQFIAESKPTWEDELKVVKAEAIMESAVEFATKFGIKLDAITHEDDAKKTLDESVSEVARLKAEVATMKREKLFMESTEGLTVVQKDKLATLLEGVEDVEDYKSKLDLFKATLLESAPKPADKKPESAPKRSWEK